MDDARFDAATRKLCLAGTRRSALWGALGGAGAALLALFASPGSGAKKKKKKCKGAGKKKCGGKCVSLRTDPNNCGACGRECEFGACTNGVCNCQGVPDCPGPCSCTVPEENNQVTACVGTVTSQVCATNSECGLGSICVAGTLRCAPACIL